VTAPDPHDDQAARALREALGHAEDAAPMPDVRASVSRRLRAEQRDGTPGYVLLQALLLLALLVAGIWYLAG